jgi:hypothetical protein
MPCRSMRSLAVAVALTVLAAVPPTEAQTVTGTILGQVVDETGGVLPGVSVTVSSPQLIGGQQTRTTGASGEFRFLALPPGTYEVGFSLNGFGALKREGVILGAGATATIDAQLKPAQLAEAITVEGESAMVDVKSAQLRETATAELIDNVPTARAFTDVFNLLPGVTSGKYNVATTGTNSVHGGTVRNNVFSLDGVNVNDPLVAYPGTDANLEMIQEVQVTTAGMSAEFGSASGAVFNVITKSGSNRFSGQVNGYLRDEGLQSDNITDELRAQGIRQGTKLTKANEWGASLGGPVRTDRLWFYGNYQKINESRTIINYPSSVEADQDMAFVKLTAQASTRNRIDAFYQYRLRYDEPFQPSINERDPKVFRQHRQSNNTWNLKWTSTISDTTFVELRGSIADQRRFTDFPNAEENDYGYQDTSTGLISGGWYRELARPGNRNSRTVKADLTHFASSFLGGSHELKVGASRDWLINEETREWLAGARLHILVDGRPDRINLSNAPVSQAGRVDQIALYAQDQWTLGRRLTLNLGLRFETIEGWYPEGSSGGVNVPQQTFPETRDVINMNNLSPRLGLVYDLTGDRKTVLRAGYGRFYNQIYTSEFDAAVPFAFGTRVFRWADANGDRVFQNGEQGALISDSTVARLGRIDPDVKQSFNDSLNVGLERELSQDVSVGAMFLWKKEYDLAETVDAAYPFDEAFQPITLPNKVTGAPITIYAQRSTSTGRPTVRLYTNPDASFCGFCVDLERNYRAVELTFKKRMSNRWQLFGSYVYSKSTGTKGQGHNESQGAVFGNPNNLLYVDGRTNLDRPHQLKLHGTWQAPWGIHLSGAYQVVSGLPWARTMRYVRGTDSSQIVVESQIVVRVEPIGAQRFDAEKQLDLRAEKKIGLGHGRSLGIIADLFNVFNASTVTAVQQTRIDHADFGKPGEILLARTLRLGARLEF